MRAQEVFNPGNGVTLPTVVREVRPDYTEAAKAEHLEGKVLLGVVVRADGTVGDVTVDESLDKVYGLDDQAVKAATQWTFKPGTKDGMAVASARPHRDAVHAEVGRCSCSGGLSSRDRFAHRSRSGRRLSKHEARRGKSAPRAISVSVIAGRADSFARLMPDCEREAAERFRAGQRRLRPGIARCCA